MRHPELDGQKFEIVEETDGKREILMKIGWKRLQSFSSLLENPFDEFRMTYAWVLDKQRKIDPDRLTV